MLWPTGRPEAVWRLEACRLVKRLGLRQHLLDPCCFLIYAQDFVKLYGPDTEAKNLFLDSGLVGMMCWHVDDMLGCIAACGDPTSSIYSKVIEELRNIYFRFENGKMAPWNTAEPP